MTMTWIRRRSDAGQNRPSDANVDAGSDVGRNEEGEPIGDDGLADCESDVFASAPQSEELESCADKSAKKRVTGGKHASRVRSTVTSVGQPELFVVAFLPVPKRLLRWFAASIAPVLSSENLPYLALNRR